MCRTARIDGKTAPELTDELANLGSHALLTALVHVQNGAAEWTEQDESQVTYASKVGKGELDLDPRHTAEAAVRKVRASSGAHPARAVVAARPVTVLALRAVEDDRGGRELAGGLAAGEVRFAGKRLFLGFADGAAEVASVKPDGRQAMDAKAFAAGVQGIKPGDAFMGGSA